jgi:hypothetical protein
LSTRCACAAPIGPVAIGCAAGAGKPAGAADAVTGIVVATGATSHTAITAPSANASTFPPMISRIVRISRKMCQAGRSRRRLNLSRRTRFGLTIF